MSELADLSKPRWPVRWWARISPWLVPALVFAALVLLVYWRAWTPVPGARRAFAWDSQWQYWGELEFQVESIRHGEWPMWNPFDRLGNPFHADPQPGTLYPLQWPLIAAGVAMKATPWWLISVKNLLHLWLLPTGMYAVCRQQKYARTAAYLAGVSVLMAQPVMWLAPSALNWSFAWIPWWLLAMLRWVERPSFGRSMWAGVAFALAGLAGAWAAVWYGMLAVLPITAVALWSALTPQRHAERRAYVRHFAFTALGALGMVVLLLGPQMLDTLALVPDTVRADRDLAFFGTSVWDGVDVIGLFLPRGTGQVAYLGWIPLLVAGLWLVRSPSRENVTLAILMVAATMLAFGSKGPVLPAAASVLGPFDLFRRAHRYAYVAVVPFGLLVGGGLSTALHACATPGPARAWWLRWIMRVSIGAIALGAIGYALKATGDGQPNPIRDAFGYLAVAALLGGGTLYVLLRDRSVGQRRLGRGANAVVVGLVFTELWFSSTESIEAAFSSIPQTPLDVVVKLPGLPIPNRIYDAGLLGFHPGIRLGLRDLGGYEEHPLALQRYARVLAAVHQRPQLATYANVAYTFERSGQNLPTLSIGKGQWYWPVVAPMVAWHDVAALAPDAENAWQHSIKSPAGEVVAVEAAQWTAAETAKLNVAETPTTPRTEGTVIDFQPNYLWASIWAPAPGVVTINELYFARGWRAWDNGQEVPIRAVNGFARGVWVEAGAHNIEMRYQPPRLWLTLGFSVLGWLVVVLWGVHYGLRRRRSVTFGGRPEMR